jgi:hypothetical protein
MLAVADRLEDLPVAEVDVTSTADLTRLLEPSAPASPVRTFRYARTKRAALTVAGSEHLGLPEVFPSWRASMCAWAGSGGGRVRFGRPPRSRHRSCGRPTGSVAAAGLPRGPGDGRRGRRSGAEGQIRSSRRPWQGRRLPFARFSPGLPPVPQGDGGDHQRHGRVGPPPAESEVKAESGEHGHR